MRFALRRRRERTAILRLGVLLFVVRLAPQRYAAMLLETSRRWLIVRIEAGR